MPSIQSLKKQLRGICSTQKLTKAMKTVATVKFSKLNTAFKQYGEYEKQCNAILSAYGSDFSEYADAADKNAPALVVVMASNKGLCGSFNSDLLKFAKTKITSFDKPYIIACGKKAVSNFRQHSIFAEKEVVFADIPTMEQSNKLIDEIIAWRKAGNVSDVYVIYPEYVNIMVQKPVMRSLFTTAESNDNKQTLIIPDRQMLIANGARTVYHSMFFGIVLETAIGAQAATLTTMRAAYDTATQFRLVLEGLINRKRQSTVTADVIETSVERSE